MLLKISPELHIRPDAKVNAVLFLDSTNVGIITLVAQQSILVSRTAALHTRCVVLAV